MRSGSSSTISSVKVGATPTPSTFRPLSSQRQCAPSAVIRRTNGVSSATSAGSVSAAQMSARGAVTTASARVSAEKRVMSDPYPASTASMRAAFRRGAVGLTSALLAGDPVLVAVALLVREVQRPAALEVRDAGAGRLVLGVGEADAVLVDLVQRRAVLEGPRSRSRCGVRGADDEGRGRDEDGGGGDAGHELLHMYSRIEDETSTLSAVRSAIRASEALVLGRPDLGPDAPCPPWRGSHCEPPNFTDKNRP